MAAFFHLRVLASDRAFYDGDCESLTVPVSDGELGILAHHSNLVAAVVPGALRARLPDGRFAEAAISGGLLKVEDGDVLLLADSVERPEEIRPALEAALAYDGPTLVDVVVDRTFSSTPPTVSRCGWDRYYPDWKAE